MTRVLELDHITKRFGAVTANEDVSLHLEQGEIVALLGENGAGKTTLMSILFGHYTADEGTVRVKGVELPPGKSRAAIRAGVGMVHQHFALAPNLTVLENVMTGTESLWKLRSDRAAGRAKLIDLSQRFGLKVDPEARVADLSVGECQRVEILKALYNDAEVLILDEPTAVLTAQEAESLFATLRQMAAKGLSLIFISHKLHEVMSASDRLEGGTGRADGRPRRQAPGTAPRDTRRGAARGGRCDAGRQGRCLASRGQLQAARGRDAGDHRRLRQRADHAGGAGLGPLSARWRRAADQGARARAL
jgi:ABC-type branched-subunit amino acid transport system ATPase component